MRILSAAQAARADALAAAAGLDLGRIMEQAGVAVATAAWERAAGAERTFVVLAGKGNNGGDGLVAARVLADRGGRVTVLVAGGPEAYGGGDPARAMALDRLAPYGVTLGRLDAAMVGAALAGHPGVVVVDAIVGTGVQGALRADVAGALERARAGASTLLAVDLPSGVDPDGGTPAEGAVAADATLALGALKVGHILYPGAALCGEVRLTAIGLAPFVAAMDGPCLERLAPRALAALLPVRAPTAHKGSGGRLLILAGSPGFGGAAVLATLGALASGAGLVTTASTEEVRQALLALAPGALSLGTGADPDAAVAAADAVAAGPGLGAGEKTLRRVLALLTAADALLLDADALNALGELGGEAWTRLRQARAAGTGRLLLTPHPGEAARLLSLPLAGAPAWPEGGERPDAGTVDRGRLGAVRALAVASGATVLLKGHPTVIARPDGQTRVNASGGPELAVGGSGDVLSGLVGGLLAQGLGAFDAAALGADLHGRAGAIAAQGGDRGVSAAAVAAAIAAAFRDLQTEGLA